MKNPNPKNKQSNRKFKVSQSDLKALYQITENKTLTDRQRTTFQYDILLNAICEYNGVDFEVYKDRDLILEVFIEKYSNDICKTHFNHIKEYTRLFLDCSLEDFKEEIIFDYKSVLRYILYSYENYCSFTFANSKQASLEPCVPSIPELIGNLINYNYIITEEFIDYIKDLPQFGEFGICGEAYLDMVRYLYFKQKYNIPICIFHIKDIFIKIQKLFDMDFDNFCKAYYILSSKYHVPERELNEVFSEFLFDDNREYASQITEISAFIEEIEYLQDIKPSYIEEKHTYRSKGLNKMLQQLEPLFYRGHDIFHLALKFVEQYKQLGSTYLLSDSSNRLKTKILKDLEIIK